MRGDVRMVDDPLRAQSLRWPRDVSWRASRSRCARSSRSCSHEVTSGAPRDRRGPRIRCVRVRIGDTMHAALDPGIGAVHSRRRRRARTGRHVGDRPWEAWVTRRHSRRPGRHCNSTRRRQSTWTVATINR